MQMTQLHLAQFLFPSSWEVIKQLFQSLRGTMNTGQSIYQLATFTIMFAVGTAMELWSWHSWQSQNVSCSKICTNDTN